MTRILVIGCGSIGLRHLRNLQQLGARDLLAFDLSEDRRARVTAELGVMTSPTLDAARAWQPDAVVVTAPTSMHVPIALDAARRGCHLFIEKPLSDSMAGVEELLYEVQRQRLVSLVGCNLRFHPGLQRLKELIQHGAIGRVVAIRAEVGQYLPDWRPQDDYRLSYSASRQMGGGIILDAIHEIDYVGWMLGPISTVACFAGKLSGLEIETEDTAGILLRFASGAIGEVHLDYVQRTYSRTCHVIGEEGTLRWEYPSPRVRWFSAADKKWHMMGTRAAWEPNQMYVDEMEHFLKCLNGRGEPSLDAAGGAEVLRVALAARLASELGRVVRPEEIC